MYRVTVDGVELEVDFRHELIWRTVKLAPHVVIDVGDHRTTSCSVSRGGVQLTCGVADCSSSDQFCRATGRKLALTRAVAELPKHVRKAIWLGYWAVRREVPEDDRDDWELAARYLLEHYPEDVFPPNGNTLDAKAGTFARRILIWLLDPIERARLAALHYERGAE